MKSLPDRILIVENDPIVIDLVSRQTLQAVGYQTVVVSDSSNAISRIIAEKPDVIIVNLSSAGLSGKDLLVALRAQDLQTPVIVLGQKGGEADVIQAFRLGAEDYLLWPLREAEIINVVERVLKQVHNTRERERLSKKLEQTNRELQQSVQELTTIYSIGKAVTSLTDQALLFERILDAAGRITQSEMGWLLLRNAANNSFLMAAQQNLPSSLKSYVNHSWDDGISSLVAMSGESLIIHGEALKRFAIASLGKSALIVPIKSQQNVLGMLIMVRKSARPFTNRQQYLLEAVADYASISLVNAHLFRTLEERAEAFQVSSNRFEAGQKILYKLLQSVNQTLGLSLKGIGIVQDEVDKESFQVNHQEKQHFQALEKELKKLERITDSLELLPDLENTGSGKSLDLNSLIKETEGLYRRILEQNKISYVTIPSSERVLVKIERSQIQLIFAGILNFVMLFSSSGSRISVQVDRLSDKMGHIIIMVSGLKPEVEDFIQELKETRQPIQVSPQQFRGVEIGMPLIKALINANQGDIRVESDSGSMISFHISIPS